MSIAVSSVAHSTLLAKYKQHIYVRVFTDPPLLLHKCTHANKHAKAPTHKPTTKPNSPNQRTKAPPQPDCPNLVPPLQKQAKWGAWSALGRLDSDAARAAYVAEVRRLCPSWSPTAAAAAAIPGRPAHERGIREEQENRMG